MYNKRTKNWFPVPMKIPKNYSYIPKLQERILLQRLIATTPMSQMAQMSDSDPRNIAPTLAGYAPPPLQELVERQASRLTRSSSASN